MEFGIDKKELTPTLVTIANKQMSLVTFLFVEVKDEHDVVIQSPKCYQTKMIRCR